MEATPVGCVRELRVALERGELPSPAVCDRIIKAIRRVENQEPDEELTLDAALGVSPSQFRKERLRRRNATLREAHERYFGELSLRAAGKRFALLGREIQTGRRLSATDGLTVLVREAIDLGVPFPGSARQIENILAGRAK